MSFKFLLIDDRSELEMGYCKQIYGLDGKIYTAEDGGLYHKISLIDFYFSEDYKEYIRKHKESLARLVYICIVDKKNIPIGKFPFNIFNNIYYHKIGFSEFYLTLDLKGSLQKTVSESELELWEKWRIAPPMSINEWSSLKEDERREWLEIVRYQSFEKEVFIDKTNGTYYLDGTYITDYSSFFCAVGEAINGPGGYFGFDMMSLRDCLRGGFGAKIPFTIVWNNANISSEKLDKESWVKEIESTRKDNLSLLETPEFEEKGDRELFLAIVKILLENRVTVILNP